MIRIWNEVVEEGIAFPQEELLDMTSGAKFFASQNYTGAAVEDGVERNVHARHLYEHLGFVQLGTIPGGFRMKNGHYENICPYYHEL